jgi:hypothetical protein
VAVLAAAHDRVPTRSDTVHGDTSTYILHSITVRLNRPITPRVTRALTDQFNTNPPRRPCLIICTINNIRQSPQPFWMSGTPDVAFLLRLLPSARD